MENTNETLNQVDNSALHKTNVSCCALLEELQLKLIAMSCFAQENFTEDAYAVTKMNIDEIKHWIKKKRSQHSS